MSLSKTDARIASPRTTLLQKIKIASFRMKNRALDQAHQRDLDALQRRNPTTEERQHDLIAFYSRYEELVELLCDAAQYGPEGKMESKYEDLRGWMQKHYGSVKHYVAAYLDFDPSDAGQNAHFERQSADAFEALFGAPTLGELLRVDDGSMISRIMRTRRALALYGDHLKQLRATNA